MAKLNWKHAGIVAAFFGVAQAAMPLLGWFLGSQFAGYIHQFDHWVAFVLLGVIGGNMIRGALSPDEEEPDGMGDSLDLRQLFLMAVATSIDALAVGVTFAFLEVLIVPAATVIGCTTFAICIAGVVVGNYFGTRYKKRAELTGGIILVCLGIKILLEHTGFLG